MDLKNQYLRLAGLDYDVRSPAQTKTERPAAPAQQTVEVLADAFQLALERLAAKTEKQPVQITETIEVDPSMVYRVPGASQPAHAYWSQVSRVAGFGLKNKKTGNMMETPYGMAFESRKEAKDYLKQAVTKEERSDWSIIDWAMECVAFDTNVEGFVLKHKEKGTTHGPRFMTPKGAEDFMNQKMSAEERKNYKIDPIQLTKESVGLGMQGFVIHNRKTNAIKSGPYDTKEEAEEYLRRHTNGVDEPEFVVKKYEDVLGHSNFPNAKGVGIGESVELDEGKTHKDKDRPSKPVGAKTLNVVLRGKKGGGHRSEKDYSRAREKETLRKEMSESIFVDENQKFLLQKEKVINYAGTAGVDNKNEVSSNRDAPAYHDPQYKRPDYEHTEISDEHEIFSREEEQGVDVPQQYGSVDVPADVLKAVRDEIAYCREIAGKTPEDVINTKGHSDKSWWKNTADMLQQVLEWLESGEEANLKRAVVKMQSWENARWWNWPSELVKFMAHYGYGYKYPKLVDKFKEVKANLIPLK